MPADQPLRVVLCWHMHQPEYRDLSSGEYRLPWTYLHITKDYVDMAAHLEAVPDARAVVNFAPVLLDQIADYAQQIEAYLNGDGAITDPLLAALAGAVLPVSAELRVQLIKDCLRANEQRLIKRFAPYERLARVATWFEHQPDDVFYLSDQYLVDILVWHHLAWMGETVRLQDPRVARLMEKGQGYSLHDRRELLVIISELVSGVIARYRRLAERGQIELSTSPYAHPIVPLMLELNSAHEAMPGAPLPLSDEYPGGRARARWHMEQGLATFERHFGFKPVGCWPSEGSVSRATLELLSEYGIRWAASGGNVLHNSLAASNMPTEGCVHKAYQLPDNDVRCFFRDDGLSDLIGFTYSDWHADDAVANLITHLENIAQACAGQADTVVSIILDGENAWEYYPDNGYHLLSALYRKLAEHPRLKLTTFSEVIEEQVPSRELPTLTAGSWVYGTFSTWIGEKDKNRGWDMLVEAKQCYDRIVAESQLDDQRRDLLVRQLAACEGSDWFWWFGDYNPAEAVSDFEQLFRTHLSNLYLMLGLEPPEHLSHAFTFGGGSPQAGGTMRHGQEPA